MNNEDTKYHLFDWRQEVGAQNTILGYHEWLEHQWESELHDIPPTCIPEMIDQQTAAGEGWRLVYIEEGDFLAVLPVFGSGLLGWDQVIPRLRERAEGGSMLHRKALWLLERYNTRRESEMAARFKLFKPGIRVRWDDGATNAEGELVGLGRPDYAEEYERWDDMPLSARILLDDGEEWQGEVLLHELEILPC